MLVSVKPKIGPLVGHWLALGRSSPRLDLALDKPNLNTKDEITNRNFKTEILKRVDTHNKPYDVIVLLTKHMLIDFNVLQRLIFVYEI